MAVRNCAELGENLQKIMTKLMSDQKLLKLLYYTDKDPINHDDLTQEQIKKEVYEKLIRITPKVTELDNANAIIVLKVLGGNRLGDNDQFRAIGLALEVYVPLTQWVIKDSNLRPFAIIGELEKTLNKLKVNGLGKLECGDFSLELLTDEISCYSLALSITSYD